MNDAGFRRRTRNVLPSLVACLLYASVSPGDIAPMRHEGYTLSAKENSDIRMQSEDANIYVGQRCRVHAKFEMQNETDRQIDQYVGFPVENEGVEEQGIYDFHVLVNEKDVPREVKRIRQEDQYGIGLTWFGWDQTFPPGRTLIEIQYHIEPSGSYNHPWQNVYYVFQTGRYWKGTIGQAVVTIHFDEPLTWERIREETTPRGFLIDDNKVRWRFTDMEPTHTDDIRDAVGTMTDESRGKHTVALTAPEP